MVIPVEGNGSGDATAADASALPFCLLIINQSALVVVNRFNLNAQLVATGGGVLIRMPLNAQFTDGHFLSFSLSFFFTLFNRFFFVCHFLLFKCTLW